MKWLLGLLCGGVMAIAQVRIVSVEPTVLFPRATPMRQVAVVTVLHEGGAAGQARFRTKLAGEQWEGVRALPAGPGVSRHRVLVKDITRPDELVVEMTTGDGKLVEWRGAWKPQRKWKVFLMESSHEDLGYEDWIFNKQKEVADFLDLARHLSGTPENQSEFERAAQNRYQYTMETLVFQRNYVEERGPEAWREIARQYVQRGTMHLGGAPSGVHHHWMDYEEMARNNYPGRVEMKHRYGLDLKTYMMVDNPSASWAGAQAAAQAGFKYVARWGQGWRTGGRNDYKTTGVPALFWWEGPNGKDRVLFGWRSHYGTGFWFGQTNTGNRSYLGDVPADFVSSYLQRVEAGEIVGPYPYDAIVEPAYGDHDVPYMDRGLLARWTSEYAYPEIRVTGPDPFFQYIEKNYAETLPVLRGDLNNYSGDYSTIDPESQGEKRRAARMLPLGETLGVITGEIASPAEMDRTYTRLFDYDEHSWPTLLPASDVQLFNAAWIKKQEASRALAIAEKAVGAGLGALARQIAVKERSVAVFNGLLQPRTSLVEYDGVIGGLVDAKTGEALAVEQRQGKTIFVARDVPAMGYKLYRIVPGVAGRRTESSAGDSIANEHYEIRFDAKSGVIRSLRDKQSGKEWVDGAAPQGMNQMVLVRTEKREALPKRLYSPAEARQMRVERGPVASTVRVWIDDPVSGAAIEQAVTLYAGLKRIDIVNDIRHAGLLYTDRFEERYRENLFYAFPFAVANGQTRAEAPGGVVRPYVDQLRWGSHDYLMANRWIDVSNAQHGVTIAPWNAASFHVGEVRYNRFSNDYQPRSSHLFSYAWSNRMAGLLTLSADDCNAKLGYSIATHEGDWNAGGAAALGWDVATPLVAVDVAPKGGATVVEKSFVAASAPNVEMVVMKPSEVPGRGWVARLVETRGQRTQFELELKNPRARRMWVTDLVENDVREVIASGDKWRLEIEPYSFLTVRFESGEKPTTAVKASAKALDDAAIEVSWTPVGELVDVYRSKDAEDPAAAQTWVGRVKGGKLVDRDLEPGQRYHYVVAPVRDNQHGAVVKVSAETGIMNRTAPMVVREAGVVRRAKDRLFVYWRKNPEGDLARYYIYRGERPDFVVDRARPLAVVKPSGKFLEVFQDGGLKPGTDYYYRIFAEDHGGLRQTESPVVTAKTPR